MDAVEPELEKDQERRGVSIHVNSPGNHISIYDRDCIEINIYHSDDDVERRHKVHGKDMAASSETSSTLANF